MADDATDTQEQATAEVEQPENSNDFRPITSQDELDRRIGERLERERSKFADYEDLKSKAARLDEIEDANKTEIQKAQERLQAAEAEVGKVPARVAEALRDHLVRLHEITDEDAELFLNASEPETLLKQVERLLARSEPKPRAPRPHAAQLGSESTPQGDWLRQQLART